MSSHKRLNGLAYDIMDHAASGLSYLQPYLSEVCHAAGVSTVTLDLLAASPLPVALHIVPAAVLACESLHRTFLSIAWKLGFTPHDIASATLSFRFIPESLSQPWCFVCISELVSSRGRRYQHARDTTVHLTGGLTTRSSEQTTALGPNWLPPLSLP